MGSVVFSILTDQALSGLRHAAFEPQQYAVFNDAVLKHSRQIYTRYMMAMNIGYVGTGTRLFSFSRALIYFNKHFLPHIRTWAEYANALKSALVAQNLVAPGDQFTNFKIVMFAKYLRSQLSSPVAVVHQRRHALADRFLEFVFADAAAEEPEPEDVVAEPEEPEPEDVVAEPEEPEPEDVVAEPEEPEPEDVVAEPEEPEPEDVVAEPEEPEPEDVVAEPEEPEPEDVVAEPEEPEPEDVVADADEPEPEGVVADADEPEEPEPEGVVADADEPEEPEPEGVVEDADEPEPEGVVEDADEPEPEGVVEDADEPEPEGVVEDADEPRVDEDGDVVMETEEMSSEGRGSKRRRSQALSYETEMSRATGTRRRYNLRNTRAREERVENLKKAEDSKRKADEAESSSKGSRKRSRR